MSWGCLTSAQLAACGTVHLLLEHWGYTLVALRDAEARKRQCVENLCQVRSWQQDGLRHSSHV